MYQKNFLRPWKKIILLGIYNDNFIKFLQDNLGNIKIKSNNIVISCPWCEISDQHKNHYHCYISTQIPIFHCFRARCPKKSGTVASLVKKIKGVDISDKFIDQDIINQKKTETKKTTNLKQLIIPDLDTDKFKLKALYIKKRLGFNIDIKSIKGLIFDIDKFVELNQNNILFNETIFKLRDYLQNNFVGFTTENTGVIFFRNIDPTSEFKHFKAKLQEAEFIDYYKLNGSGFNTNHIILAEGVFDIWSEYIFDTLELRNKTKIYASVLSSNYLSLIKSVAYNENIYRLDISILSDRDVSLDYYKKLKYYNDHIINSLTIFYNRNGKDFNDFPLIPEKFII